MFNINKTILYGFSMGGYGVWRMSLLHPEFFDLAVCASGSPVPFIGDEKNYNMNNFIGRGKNISFLVMHGTEDNAIKINNVDNFVRKLKENNYDIEYVRIKGAGHGNYKSKVLVNTWLVKKLKNREMND